MSIVKLAHADVAERSGYACGFTHPEHGRCAQSAATEDHHIILRSHGGSDAPENRVMVCTRHHQQIHAQGSPWIYRVQHNTRSKHTRVDGDSDSTNIVNLYVEDIEADGKDYLERLVAMLDADRQDLDEVVEAIRLRGFVVWRLWPDVEEEWQARAIALDAQLNNLISGATQHAWNLAQVSYSIQYEGQLWALFGFDSMADYGDDKDINGKTLMGYARAEKNFRKIVPEELREQGRMMPIRVWTQKGHALAKLTPSEIEEVIGASASIPSRALIEHIDEMAPTRTGKPRYTVKFDIEKAVVEINVEAGSKEVAIDKAKKTLLGYKSLEVQKLAKTSAKKTKEGS